MNTRALHVATGMGDDAPKAECLGADQHHVHPARWKVLWR